MKKPKTDLEEKVKQYIKDIDIKLDSKEGYLRILLEYVEYVDNLSNLPKRQDIITYRDT